MAVKLYTPMGKLRIFNIIDGRAIHYSPALFLYLDPDSECWFPYEELIDPGYAPVDEDDRYYANA